MSQRFASFRLTPFDRYLVAILLLLMYFTATALAGSRQLWFDELHTYYIAQAPSLQQLFRNLQLDLNPPLEYLAVRGSLALLGDHPYVARLPSILAFLIGTFCFYRFVAKRLQPLYGLLAVLIFWSTPFFAYATEARPYALVVACFGIAMLAWDQSTSPTRSLASVLLLTLSISGMMLSHIFSVLFIAPFCLAEAWRLYRSRRIEWRVWAALLLPMIIPFAFLKLMANFTATPFPPMFEASPRKLAAFYYHFLAPEAPALVLALGLALLIGFRSKRVRASQTPAMTSAEIAFIAGLLALPEIVMLVLMETHGAFFPRYAILSAFGLALLLVFALARLTGRSGLAAALASGILFLYDAGAIKSGYDLHRTLKEWPPKEAALARIRPDLPLVISSGFTFMELGKYALPSTARRMYYLISPDLALKYAHASMFQDFATRKNFFPMRGTVEPYQQFVAAHRQFLVFGTPGLVENWLLRWLNDVHATVQFAGTFPGPYSDKELYEVTMPADVVQTQAGH